MPLVDVVCLANSRKYGGRCVAGLRAAGGGWVRPVSRGHDGVLLPQHYKLSDGSDARVLDLLRIDLAGPRPGPHQPENWVIGSRQWELLARPAPADLVAGVVRRHLLMGPSLLGSESDRVPFSTFSENHAIASLALVAPSRVEWEIRVPAPGTRHTRAVFRLGEAEYDLSVTDLAWEYRLLRLPPGRHSMQAAGLADGDRLLLTISLGEPYAVDDCCYKLVAAITIASLSLIRALADFQNY
ncbi:MAG TPA: hypothetical protein VNL16_16280 [Chloroflexota bacterium]|nr:hypothetical protein [Chloroflexota bacterium]